MNSSDVPGGVVNLLTGTQKEVATTLASHMDVNALVGSTPDLNSFSELAVDNLKRLIPFDADWMKVEAQGLHFVTDVQEVKTTWHPIENIGGATSSY